MDEEETIEVLLSVYGKILNLKKHNLHLLSMLKSPLQLDFDKHRLNN